MGRGALEPTELVSEVSVIERKDGTNVTDLNQQFLNNYIKDFGMIKLITRSILNGQVRRLTRCNFTRDRRTSSTDPH